MDIAYSDSLLDEYAGYDWYDELEKMGLSRNQKLLPYLLDLLQDSKIVPWAVKVLIYSTLRQMAECNAMQERTISSIDATLPSCATAKAHRITPRCTLCSACTIKYHISLLKSLLLLKFPEVLQESGQGVDDLNEHV